MANTNNSMALANHLFDRYASSLDEMFSWYWIHDHEKDVINSLPKLKFSYHASAYIESKDNKTTIQIPVPGLKKEDITISIENNLLKVNTRFGEDSTSNKKFLDNLDLTYKLNKDYDKDRIKASLDDGILKIDLIENEQAHKSILIE